MHLDRHEGVTQAAQLGALAVIDARFLDRQHALVQAAGNRVQLEPQARHREGVDHVRAEGLDTQRHAHRHDHAVIHRQLRRQTGRQRFFRWQHVRNHFEPALVGIGVAPVPLVAYCFYSYICFWDFIL